MKSVQKTDDGRLAEGSNPSASATALILCGIRAGEGFFFCFSLRISDSNSGTDIPFARSFPIFSDVSSDQAPAVISILRTFCNEIHL